MRVTRRRFTSLLAVFACALLAPQAAFAQFDELLQRVPDGANALVLLNVEKARSSPYAQKRGTWVTQLH